MAKYKIGVVSGVAAVYPEGMSAACKTLHAGESIAFDETSYYQPGEKPTPMKVGDGSAAQKDIIAPAAGVATTEPYNMRAGVIQVEALTGPVLVRVYEADEFKEEKLSEGNKRSVPVTETNRITLAVYEAAEPRAATAEKKVEAKK